MIIELVEILIYANDMERLRESGKERGDILEG
jgi:hypothetical protein